MALSVGVASRGSGNLNAENAENSPSSQGNSRKCISLLLCEFSAFSALTSLPYVAKSTPNQEPRRIQ